MASLPVSPDRIHDELKSIQKIINHWESYLDQTKLPGIDVQAPDAEEKLELFVRQLSGEMMFAAGKCHNLAVVLAEQ